MVWENINVWIVCWSTVWFLRSVFPCCWDVAHGFSDRRYLVYIREKRMWSRAAWRFLPLQQCRIFCVALWICFPEHCGGWDIRQCRWSCRWSVRSEREFSGFLDFSHITDRCTSCLFLIRHPGSSRLWCRSSVFILWEKRCAGNWCGDKTQRKKCAQKSETIFGHLVSWRKRENMLL